MYKQVVHSSIMLCPVVLVQPALLTSPSPQQHTRRMWPEWVWRERRHHCHYDGTCPETCHLVTCETTTGRTMTTTAQTHSIHHPSDTSIIGVYSSSWRQTAAGLLPGGVFSSGNISNCSCVTRKEQRYHKHIQWPRKLHTYMYCMNPF